MPGLTGRQCENKWKNMKLKVFTEDGQKLKRPFYFDALVDIIDDQSSGVLARNAILSHEATNSPLKPKLGSKRDSPYLNVLKECQDKDQDVVELTVTEPTEVNVSVLDDSSRHSCHFNTFAIFSRQSWNCLTTHRDASGSTW